MDEQTIEACKKIALKIGEEYGSTAERVGAFSKLIARGLDLLKTHSLDQILNEDGVLWADKRRDEVA
jgi:ribosomal protein S9